MGEDSITDEGREEGKEEAIEPSNPPPRHCLGKRKDGGPCGMSPMRGTDWCPLHTPDESVRVKVREGRKHGGRIHRANKKGPKRLYEVEVPPEIKSKDQIFNMLEVTTRAVLCGRIDPKQANAAAYCLNVMNSMLGDREFEERIQKLEKALDEKDKQARGASSGA